LLDDALSVAGQLGHPEDSPSVLIQLAVLHLFARRYDEAESYLARIDPLVPSLAKPLLAYRDEVYARLRLAQGRLDEAERHFRSALENHEPRDIEMRRLSDYQGLGECLEALGRFAEAAGAYEHALKVYAEHRDLLNEGSRVEFAGFADALQQSLIVLYADTGKPTHNPEKALVWVDKAKSRALVDMLRHSFLALTPTRDQVRPWVEEEQKHLATVQGIRNHLLKASMDPAERLVLNQRLDQAKHELSGVWAKLREAAPEYVALRSGFELTWPDVKTLVD